MNIYVYLVRLNEATGQSARWAGEPETVIELFLLDPDLPPQLETDGMKGEQKMPMNFLSFFLLSLWAPIQLQNKGALPDRCEQLINHFVNAPNTDLLTPQSSAKQKQENDCTSLSRFER